MKRTLTGLCLAVTMLIPAMSTQAEELTYYMPLEEALKIVPNDRTLHYSRELGKDLTQFPIPWEEQVRNAITNAGGSDTKDFVGGTKY